MSSQGASRRARTACCSAVRRLSPGCLCPLSTQHCTGPAETAAGEAPDIRAYKLGKERWSYNQCEATVSLIGGSRRLQVVEASLAAGPPEPLRNQEGTLAYHVRLSNGATLLISIFVVYADAYHQTADKTGLCGRTMSGQGYQWIAVTRDACNKGCQGPILRPIQRLGRLGKRNCPLDSTLRPDKAKIKDPRYLYLSIDEACSHVGARRFRLLAGAYATAGLDCLGTACSAPIRVLANNDVPTGAASIKLDIAVGAEWEGWQLERPRLRPARSPCGLLSVPATPARRAGLGRGRQHTPCSAASSQQVGDLAAPEAVAAAATCPATQRVGRKRRRSCQARQASPSSERGSASRKQDSAANQLPSNQSDMQPPGGQACIGRVAGGECGGWVGGAPLPLLQEALRNVLLRDQQGDGSLTRELLQLAALPGGTAGAAALVSLDTVTRALQEGSKRTRLAALQAQSGKGGHPADTPAGGPSEDAYLSAHSLDSSAIPHTPAALESLVQEAAASAHVCSGADLATQVRHSLPDYLPVSTPPSCGGLAPPTLQLPWLLAPAFADVPAQPLPGGSRLPGEAVLDGLFPLPSVPWPWPGIEDAGRPASEVCHGAAAPLELEPLVSQAPAAHCWGSG